MIAGLLGGLLALLRPGAGVGEAVLVVGLVAAVLAVLAVVRAIEVPATALRDDDGHGFAQLRVLLRVSDPDAAGHSRARAPGATR